MQKLAWGFASRLQSSFTKTDLPGSNWLWNWLAVAVSLAFPLKSSRATLFKSIHTHSMRFLSPTPWKLKIIPQTFTASWTSKSPAPHLFYFCFPFSTFPFPLCIFTALQIGRHRKEENARSTKEGDGSEGSIPTSTFCLEQVRSPAVSNKPSNLALLTRGWGVSGHTSNWGPRPVRMTGWTTGSPSLRERGASQRQLMECKKQRRRRDLPLFHSWS